MFDHVLRPGTIGPLQLAHRIVMGSMHLGLEGGEDDGRALAAFYAERARAGVGLIVTGGAAVSRVGAAGRRYALINEPTGASTLARVADAVHEAGGRVLMQLFHAGRYAPTDTHGLQPVAPSAVYSPLARAEPRALSGDEIRDTIDDFARAAARARELGFDGVEIMGSEGYLLNQFTAPATNRRSDEWGGDAQRRHAFPLAVTAAVRAAAGPSLAVVYRLSGADLVADGTPPQEVHALAARLAGDGLVDALNVGIGWHEARVPTVQLVVPAGAWRPWARAVREAVAGCERELEVPVIASNRVATVTLADEVIAAGDADFVSMARPLLADAEIVAKARASASRAAGGRAVNVCIACDQACVDRSIFDARVSCVVNPRAGYELEALAAPAPPRGTRVAVIGGGPAGMEAARALAAAGCTVVLRETAPRVGGQFRMACRIPGKEDYERTIEYFEAELSRLEVEVVVDAPVTEVGEVAGFDAVVLATGVTPRRIELPGAELPHVLSYAALLDAGAGSGADVAAALTDGLADGPVAIIGAGGIGVDVAHRLSHVSSDDPRAAFYAAHGLRGRGARIVSTVPDPAAASSPRSPRQVTLMRRAGRVGASIGPTMRWAIIDELRRAGVDMLTGVSYQRIEPGAVHIRDADGTERAIAAATVIVAAGQERADALVPGLRAAGIPHVVIGGAAQAGELDAERVFREGADAPAALARLIASPA